MTGRSRILALVVFAIVLAVAVALVLQTIGSGTAAGAIEENVAYQVGYSYLADLDMGDGKLERARVFDFADRNLPEWSLVVPLKDPQGIIPLVVASAELPMSTVQKVRIQIPEQMIEGVIYPAYEFVQFQYHFETTEKQSVIPVLKPRS